MQQNLLLYYRGKTIFYKTVSCTDDINCTFKKFCSLMLRLHFSLGWELKIYICSTLWSSTPSASSMTSQGGPSMLGERGTEVSVYRDVYMMCRKQLSKVRLVFKRTCEGALGLKCANTMRCIQCTPSHHIAITIYVAFSTFYIQISACLQLDIGVSSSNDDELLL